MPSKVTCAIAVVAVFLSLIPASSFAQQNPRDLYQRARMLDDSSRNLMKAIRLYSQFISLEKNNRALVAEAQYRIGVLYNRIGRKQDAQRAFKTVVTQYPDQTPIAERARSRLIPNGREKPALEIKRTGRSPDERILASFTFPKGWQLSPPVFDPKRPRAYSVAHRITRVGAGEKLPRGAKRSLSLVYWPSSLVVIDTKTNTIFKTISFQVFLGSVTYNPANDKLYANATVDGHVRVIDPDTFSTLTKIPVPGFPQWFAFNPLTNKVYLSSQGFAGNDKLFVIDGATNAVEGPFDLNGVAGLVVVNTATNRVYASAHEKTRVFDGQNNSVLADLPGIEVFAADPTQNRLYGRTLSTGRTADLQMLDGNTHDDIKTFGYKDVIGDKSSGDLDTENNRFYFSIPDRNQVIALDTATNSEIARLSPVEYPTDLAVDPVTKNLYICHVSDSLTRVTVVAKQTFEQMEVPDEFSDSFDEEKLDPAWEIIKGDGGYSLTENPGHLRFRTAVPSGPEPYLTLMRSFRGDHWVFETKVSYFTGTGGGTRTLRFAISFGAPFLHGTRRADSYIYLSRYRSSWDDCCPGWIGGGGVIDNKAVIEFDNTPPNASDSYVFRITRNGRNLTIERSDDGISFTLLAAHSFGPQIDAVIHYLTISYGTDANRDAYADYDYVQLTRLSPNASSRH
jgi:DNA-binding beta-propeller fold protein YncE